MKHLYYTSIVLALIILGCQSQNGLSEYENTEIVFGSGGGFSGQEIEYRISTNRLIVSFNSLTKETIEIGKISKGKTRNLYEQLAGLNLPSLNFNHPGNMYYYVKESKGTKEAKVVWGDHQKEVPAEVKEYYDILMSIVSEKNK